MAIGSLGVVKICKMVTYEGGWDICGVRAVITDRRLKDLIMINRFGHDQ